MKINCNVIKDLIPQYVDGALSAESKELVTEHIGECESCKAYIKEVEMTYAELDGSADDFRETDSSEGIIVQGELAALKKIKRKINFKRTLAVLITAGFAVVAVFAGYLYINEHLSYIPYEKTGIVSTNNILSTPNNYQMLLAYSCEYEVENIEFMILCSSPASRNEKPKGVIEFADMNKEYGESVDENGEILTEKLSKIYYLPKEAINKLPFIYSPKYMLLGNTDEILNKGEIKTLVEQSTLIWER